VSVKEGNCCRWCCRRDLVLAVASLLASVVLVDLVLYLCKVVASVMRGFEQARRRRSECVKWRRGQRLQD